MDLSKLSDADLQALAGGDMTKLSDEGLGILAGNVAPKEPSFLDKAVGVGEAGLNLLTAGTTGALAGAVGGAQGILDSISAGTFGTKQGVSNAEAKFIEQMQMATYEPRTETGKKYANTAGEFVMQNAPALVAVAPQLEIGRAHV